MLYRIGSCGNEETIDKENVFKLEKKQKQSWLYWHTVHVEPYFYQCPNLSCRNTGKLIEKKYILEGNIESSPVPEIERKHCPFIVYTCMCIYIASPN
jgi:hypothetical protein